MKLNGNLTLNTGGASEIQNAILERVASNPSIVAGEKGRIIFNTTNGLYYFNNGTSWSPFATGGDAATLQAEVDAVETSLGSLVNADGTFAAGAFSGFTNVVTPTSVTNALSQLDAAISGKDQLSELTDVTLTAPSEGQYLQYLSGAWKNSTLTLSKVTDVTASASEVNQLTSSGITTADLVKLHAVTSSAAELNKLTGATVSTTELNYVTGVTSSIQTQLNNKQPLEATLTGIAALDTATTDSIIFTSDGATFTYDAGAGARSRLGLVYGVDVQAWDADLDDLAAFEPASSTEDPAGQGSRTVYDMIVGTGTTEGSRWTLQRGSTLRSSLGLGDIAVYDASKFIKTDGTSTVTGNITLSGFKLLNVGSPTASGDAVNKAYVDSLASGLLWKDPVNLVNLVGSATSPVGAPVDLDSYIIDTGGNTGDWSAFAVGDVVQWHDNPGDWQLVRALQVGDRYGVAFYNETTPTGVLAGQMLSIATITNATPGSLAATFETPSIGDSVFIGDPGAALFGRSYTYVASTAAPTGNPTHSWVQFSGPGATNAGVGLYYSGNTLHIGLGAGIKELPSDEVGIDLYDNATGAIILTTDGSTRAPAPGTAAQLHLLLKTSQFTQSVNGLELVPSAITSVELASSVAGNGLVGGNGSALAVASHAGTSGTIGTLVIGADTVGVALGTTSTTAAPGNHVHSAAATTFDNTIAGLAGSPNNVKSAIEALDAAIDTIGAGNIPTIQAEIDAIETAVGLNTDGTFSAHTGTNYINGGTSVKSVAGLLDTAIKTVSDATVTNANKLAASYFLYTGSSSTSHVVTHSIGQKFCNVTVVDASDEVIIPQSIKFDDANQLTVTFNTAIACSVVVMGVS